MALDCVRAVIPAGGYGVIAGPAVLANLNLAGVIKAYILPAPLSIAQSMVKVHEVILDHARVTLVEALLAFVIGNGLAVLLAIVFVHNTTAERSLYPLALAARSIPAAAKWVVENRLVDGLDLEQQTAQANAMIELLQPPGMTRPLLSLESDTWKATAQAAKDAGTVTSVLDVASLLNLDTVTQASK